MFYVAFVASLGGLLFGFDTAVISGAEKGDPGDLCALGLRARLHDRHGAYRHHRRRPGLRRPSRTLRAPALAESDRVALPDLGRGQCRDRQLVFVHVLPLPGRAGRRRLVGRGADVYRRDLPVALARAFRGLLPVQHRAGHRHRLPDQLLDRGDSPRLAVDAGHRGRPGTGLRPVADDRARKPPLAAYPQP